MIAPRQPERRPCVYCGRMFRPRCYGDTRKRQRYANDGKVCHRQACQAQSRNASLEARRAAERMLKHFRQPIQPSRCCHCGTELKCGTNGNGLLISWCPEGHRMTA